MLAFIANSASFGDINTIRQSLGEVLGYKLYIGNWGQVSGTSLGFENNKDSAFGLHLDDTDLNDGGKFRDIAVASNQTAVVQVKEICMHLVEVNMEDWELEKMLDQVVVHLELNMMLTHSK